MVADKDFLYLGTSNGKVVSIPLHALKKDFSHQGLQASQDSVEVIEVKEVKEVKGVREVKSKRAEKGVKREERGHKREERGRDKKEGTRREAGVKREERGVKREGRGAKREEEREERALRRDKERALRSAKEKEEMTEHCLSHCTISLHSHMDERVRDLLFLQLPEARLSTLKQASESLHYHSLPNLASPHGGRIPVSPPILSFRSLVLAVGRGHVEYVEGKGGVGGEVGGGGEGEGDEEGNARRLHRERQEAFQLLVWGHKNRS